MENAAGGSAKNFKGGAGERCGEREGIGSEGDALSCGVGGAGIEVGGTGKLVEGVIPEDFACGGVTIHETCSFEGRNPESGSGSCSFPDEGAAGTEGGGGVESGAGDGPDDFEGFCGRRGADTNRGIEDVEFVGGLIVEFESACGGRETEEGVVGHDEVARDGNVSGDGFTEVESGACGAGDVSTEDREIGADRCGGFYGEGARGTQFILGMEDTTRGGADDFEGGSGEGGAEAEGIGGIERDTLSGSVGGVRVGAAGEASGGAVPSECLVRCVTIGETDSLERRCYVEGGTTNCSFPDERAGGGKGVLRMENAAGGSAEDFEGGSGEGGAEGDNTAADGDALTCGRRSCVEIGGTRKTIRSVVPDHFLCGGIAVREARSFEGRDPEIGTGGRAFPDKSAGG